MGKNTPNYIHNFPKLQVDSVWEGFTVPCSHTGRWEQVLADFQTAWAEAHSGMEAVSCVGGKNLAKMVTLGTTLS